MSAKARPPRRRKPLPDGQASKTERERLLLLHQVSVYQEEIVVQNEALIRAQSAIEQTRDRFVELYEFAPHGYVTLDRQGVIRQCNLTASALFGRTRPSLEGIPLLNFVVPECQRRYYQFLNRCRAGDAVIEAAVSLKIADGIREVELLSRPHQSVHTPAEYLTAIIDVTRRNDLERDRARIAAEHSALASRLLSAHEEERQRLARNLHDDIGQQVTAVRLVLQSLMRQTGSSEMNAVLVKLMEMTEQLDERLHFASAELRPAALDVGLVSALEQFVREWSQLFGIAARFVVTGNPGSLPSSEIDVQLYRIAQEALNNVSKHASARQVSVRLDLREEAIILTLKDDGRGFETSKVRESPMASLGLASIRERAQLMGGTAHIESIPGDGTSVRVRVPRRPGAQ